MHPILSWFKRAKKETEYTYLDIPEIAAECQVSQEEVKTAIEFLSENTDKRIDVFMFLVEQIQSA